jgi:hypothetical protein
MKRVLAISAVAAIASFGLAPVAQAGEVTGNGKPTPIARPTVQAASICAYSGLDDVDEGEDPDDPTTDDFGRTQNWGQIPKEFRAVLTAEGANPGKSCKPGGEH